MIKLDEHSLFFKKYKYKGGKDVDNREEANKEFKRQLALFRKYTMKMTASADTDNGQ